MVPPPPTPARSHSYSHTRAGSQPYLHSQDISPPEPTLFSADSASLRPSQAAPFAVSPPLHQFTSGTKQQFSSLGSNSGNAYTGPVGGTGDNSSQYSREETRLSSSPSTSDPFSDQGHPFSPPLWPSVASNVSAAPVAIPQRTQSPRPPTPLTGRPRGLQNIFESAFEGHQMAIPAPSRNMPPPRSHRHISSAAGPPPPRSPPGQGSRSSSMSIPAPTSPLGRSSKPIPIPSSASENSRKIRRPDQPLKLAGLPKFHPANFSHADDSDPLSPQTVRALGPRIARGDTIREPSDSHSRVQQYQRDVVANFARNTSAARAAHNPSNTHLNPLSPTQHLRRKHSPSHSQGSVGSGPGSPRLEPHGSPAGPMTPLALESSDYVLAGAGVSALHDNGRDLVERLVHRENDRRRRRHLDAGTGAMSPALSPQISPAVSPAGGRG